MYANSSDLIHEKSKFSDVLDEDAKNDPISIDKVSKIGKQSQYQDHSEVNKFSKPEIPRSPDQPDSFMGSAPNPFSKIGRFRIGSKDSGLTKEMGLGSNQQLPSPSKQPKSYQFKERLTDEIIDDMV
jgi:hypothetical protein